MGKVTFYIRDDQKEVYEKLKSILMRERVSFSEWVWNLIYEYVKRHEPGNPQLRLNQFDRAISDPREKFTLCAHRAWEEGRMDRSVSMAYCLKKREYVGQYFTSCLSCSDFERR